MLDFLSPPKIVSDARDALRLFILLSSEKNEPRSAAAVIGLLARRYGLAVGDCGTRSARTVLALFPPSSLRLHRPIKAESGDLACILTPSPCGHSPYIPCRNTGEKGNTRFGNEVEFYCFVTPRHVTGHGRGGLNA